MSLEGVAPSPVTSNRHKVSPVGRLEGEFLGHPGVDSGLPQQGLTVRSLVRELSFPKATRCSQKKSNQSKFFFFLKGEAVRVAAFLLAPSVLTSLQVHGLELWWGDPCAPENLMEAVHSHP